MSRPITQTALEKMRRAAKQRSREGNFAYTAALDEQARAAGFPSWDAARKAAGSAPASALRASSAFELPVDPYLPPHFDSLANERRSKAELDQWWLRPFAVSLGDGSYDVRCLDGGAWDRPSFYGIAKDLQEAHEVARRGLARWQQVRDTPVFQLGAEAVLLILEPNQPGCARPVLYAAGSMEAAKKLAEQWETLRKDNPEAAARAVRAARDRSSRIITDEQAEALFQRSRTLGVVLDGGDEPDFEDIALLAGVYRLSEPGTLTVSFSAPELANYFFHLGLGDVTSVQTRLGRISQLRLEGRPLIQSATSQMRNELSVWEVRFSAETWPARAVRRTKG